MAPTSSIVNEDLANLSLEVQWTRPTREGAMRAGLRAAGRDVTSLHGVAGDRTYRSAAADLLMVLFGERARVVVGAGPRAFQYKLSDEASWLGGGATARGEFPLWRGGDQDDRSLELATTWAVEQRAYFGKASTNICAPGDTYMCVAATPRRRGDLVVRGGAALTYTSSVVASLDVQVTSLDSNSYGQSWQGVRVRAATTTSTALGFVSLTATVNAERYPEGLVVRNADLGSYETLDADNRSSLELRLSRRLGSSSELELRAAMWRDLFRDTAYQRFLASVGVIWGR